MKFIASIALAAVWSIVGTTAAGAENLGEMLRDSGWDRLIGVWVDKETKGKTHETVYAWKFKDQLIEVNTRTRDVKSTALIGVNAKTGEVYCMAADNKGTGLLGKWIEEGGDAVLEAGFITGDSVEGQLRVRHHLKDDDTLVVTFEQPEPFTMTLVREKKKAPKAGGH